MAAKRKTITRGSRRKKRSRLPECLIILVLLAGTCFAGWKIWNSDTVQMRFVYMWEHQQDIITYSQKNKVDPFLIAAIIKNESNFNHKAVSKVGAVGLMQIMPETGRWIAEQMGCWYLGELDHEFKHNLALVMTAYNAGRGQTHEWMQQYGWDDNFNDLKAIPFPDTREYVQKVLQDRDKDYLLYRDKVPLQ